VKNIDKLPHHKQMAVIYEVANFSKSKIASELGVTMVTLATWRRDPEYQAALQEVGSEVRNATLEKYVSPMHIALDGYMQEIIRRVNDKDDLFTMPTERMIKSLQVFFNLLDQAKPRAGSDTPDVSKPGEKKKDVLHELKKRYSASQTGQEMQGDEEEDDA
jgi:hypothetical protein